MTSPSDIDQAFRDTVRHRAERAIGEAKRLNAKPMLSLDARDVVALLDRFEDVLASCDKMLAERSRPREPKR